MQEKNKSGFLFYERSNSKELPKKAADVKDFSKIMVLTLTVHHFFQDKVTYTISGIQNPERATLRQKMAAMGGEYKADLYHPQHFANFFQRC